MTEVTAEQINAMKDMQTCAVSNAIESLGVRSRTEGFMSPDIKSMFPSMGAMVGHAVTAVIKASTPPSDNMNFSRVIPNNIKKILNGEIKSKYTLKRLKKRLIEEGYMVEECSICNWNEARITDGLICLGLDFLDGDSTHTTLENMRLLCPNCYLSNNGVLHNSKVFCK